MEPDPVGRVGEIEDIHAFLSATMGAPAALAITGDIGIGKTMVWRHVVRAARRSSRVLSCQPASTARPLGFSALDDLLGGVAAEILPALPMFREGCRAFPLGLDRFLLPDRLRHVRLGPLSPGSISEILRSRLGAVLPRYIQTRLYEACGGNPYYALEYARALFEHPRLPLTNEPTPIPIPRSLSDLVRRRVSQLTPDARHVGRLVAASANPRERLIRAACIDGESWAAIDRAVDDGIIERHSDVLRFTHPLLPSALYSEMRLNERREVHKQLGAAAEDMEERAWHLALGSDRSSEEIAGMLDESAWHAASRGAPEDAAASEEQAIRLTMVGQPGKIRERTLRAADYHFRAGDFTRSQELIESALASCQPGPLRAPLLLRLATIHYHQNGWPLAEQTFRQAARDAPKGPALRAQAEQELALARLVAGDLTDATRWAKLSLRTAERAADPRLVAHSLARVALFEFLRGNGVRADLLERAEALDASAGEEPIGRLPMLDPSLATGVVNRRIEKGLSMYVHRQHRETDDSHVSNHSPQ